jgi:hypothetical protein
MNEGTVPPVFTSAEDGADLNVQAALPPGKEPPVSTGYESWVGHKDGLDAMPGIELGPSSP